MPPNYQPIKSLYFSQNFLTSTKTIERLLRISNIGKHDHVIEIGAGKGHITRILVRKSKLVTAVEPDRQLFSKLQKNLKTIPNLKLLNIDFLKMRLPINESYKVFSNIPFAITTDIMRKLFEAKTPPVETWLVMEKGAAKRFMGQPNENINSFYLKPFFDLKIVYYFLKNDFHPKPSADTVLLYIKQKEHPDLALSERKNFKFFLTHISKYGMFNVLTKKQVATALKLENLPPIEHADKIIDTQWLALFRYWSKFSSHHLT
ncbi:MAG TPA: rRNA adenine N(6)-methyltransferase family protein [Lachnospiraceae bacterium]|mgnify:CR=1 FL=1|nr:rRNA adenine N(6)-methyltransferase family protein [Lachnospiraceae bacterium]